MNTRQACAGVLGILMLVGFFGGAAAQTNPSQTTVPSDRVQIEGFVSAGYQAYTASGRNQWQADEAELDISRHLDDLLLLQLDVEIRDAETVAAEQAFLQYIPPRAERLTLTVGRFNAPLGVEAVDPPEMHMASHSVLFTSHLPLSLTGAMLSVRLPYHLHAAVFVANGWERTLDNNKSKAFGGRISVRPNDRFEAGLGGYYGAEDAFEQDQRTLVDLTAHWQPQDRLTLLAEAIYGRLTTDRRRADDRSWAAFLLLADWRVSPLIALSGRADVVAGEDDLLATAVPGEDGWHGSLAVGPRLQLGPGLVARGELRLLGAKDAVYLGQDDELVESDALVSLELVYEF